MDQKEWRKKAAKLLSSYKSSKVAIEMLQSDKKALEAMIINSRMATDYERSGGGSKHHAASVVESKAIELEEKRSQIDGQIAFLQNQLDKVDIALDNLETPYKTLLKLKYVEGKRWVEVYRFLNYSEEYIRTKLNNKALDKAVSYLFPQWQQAESFEES